MLKRGFFLESNKKILLYSTIGILFLCLFECAHIVDGAFVTSVTNPAGDSLDGASNVERNLYAVYVSFDTTVLYSSTTPGPNFNQITITKGSGQQVDNQLIWEDVWGTFRIEMPSLLEFDTTYTINIPEGAVQDVITDADGNVIRVLSQPYSTSFTTISRTLAVDEFDWNKGLLVHFNAPSGIIRGTDSEKISLTKNGQPINLSGKVDYGVRWGDSSTLAINIPILEADALYVLTIPRDAVWDGGNCNAMPEEYISQHVEPPHPYFEATPTSGIAPLTVKFADYSGGWSTINAWEWDFNNDGSVDSTEQNPSFTYSEPGTYSVNLTVTGLRGTGSYTCLDYIVVKGVKVHSITPREIVQGSENVDISVLGSGFASGATAKLVNATLGEIAFLPNTVTRISESELHGQISFTNAKPGLYDVVVINPDSTTGTLEKGFRVGPVPVVLVHGWRGNPSVWDELNLRLDMAGYTIGDSSGSDNVWIFDYGAYNTEDPRIIADELNLFIERHRGYSSPRYDGPIDIVCHSMGALVTRHYMEVDHRDAQVRTWIGIAPVNSGAAIADLRENKPLNWFVGFIRVLVFWKDIVNPNEPAVVQMETNSATVTQLNRADSPRPDVTYRVIAGYNSDQNARYAGIFGKTIELDTSTVPPTTKKTYYGDGVVALRQSILSQAGLDCFGGEDHNSLTHNWDVCELVLHYLQHPESELSINWPTTDEGRELFDPDTYQVGTVYPGSSQEQQVTVSGGASNLKFQLTWPGSDLDLSLTSPSGHQIHGPDPLVHNFTKTNTTITYEIERPESGLWTARIDAIDVHPDGEPFVLTNILEVDQPTSIPGEVSAPTDVNSDGTYDDVNGNGRPDFADVVLYFNQMAWIAANEPVELFDYNGNGRIDFADVVWLFNHL